MILTSILALTDFSVDGDKALARAGEIACEHAAVLRIMTMPSDTHSACLDPDTRLLHTATAMARRLGVTVRAVGAGNYSLDNIVLQAEKASLMVLPQRSERGILATWLLGPDAIRLARLSRCPVLLARGPLQRGLRQIVVGVDLTPASHHRAKLACLLDRTAQVELFHAVNLNGTSTLSQSDTQHRASARYQNNRIEHEARLQLSRMTASLNREAEPVVSSAAQGQPAEQLMARMAQTGADLVVVGKSRRSAAIDWCMGSTAHDLIAQSPCDVLVVPDDFTFSGISPRGVPTGRGERLQMN